MPGYSPFFCVTKISWCPGCAFPPTFHPKLCLISGSPQPTPPGLTQARHPLLKENEGWWDDLGMWYISVPVSCHVARQNVARELLQDPWVPSREKEMESGCPILCSRPSHKWKDTFDPMAFTSIIHCSSELFCSAQILFCSPFCLILLVRRWCFSKRR